MTRKLGIAGILLLNTSLFAMNKEVDKDRSISNGVVVTVVGDKIYVGIPERGIEILKNTPENQLIAEAMRQKYEKDGGKKY